jgi:uncharacterized protein (TIGR03437 family)
MGASTTAFFLCLGAASGQIVTDINAIPNTGKPPVVFVNGYQRTCSGTTFSGTFGAADKILQPDNRVSLFFDICSKNDHPPIEELGNRLGDFLRSLKYQSGEAVSQVDIVAHSMGGLVVRSYLSGKQTQEGVFTPPADTKVRKIIFLGTPHFGSPATSLLGGPFGGGDSQTDELQTGSPFTFDLATWNQGIDDLRGADAISVLGNVSNGVLLMKSKFGDGVTTLVSGSLGFVAPDRTQIIPYCHTDIASLLCSDSKGNIAAMDTAEHQSAQIILSFLNDTPAWRTIGQPAPQNEFLSKNAGLLVRLKDANDRTQSLTKAVATGQGDLTIISQQLGFADQLTVAQQPLQLVLTAGGLSTTINVPLTLGATRALILKSGPSIDAVLPSAAAVFPRTVAPGSLISIYGTQLTPGSGQLDVNVAGRAMPISYASATQINSLVPDNASGLVKLQVKSSTGEQTVNLLVEPTVPTIFAPALNALTNALVTPQSPLHPGDYVSLYLTGLGQTREQAGLNWAIIQPQVSFGGQPCIVSFAGRAPGFPGLDQINCKVSATLEPTDAAQVVVRSGSRFSNTTTLPVR